MQIELLFGGVSDLALTGISTDLIADISLRYDGALSVDLTSSVMRMSAQAKSVTVGKIDAYLAER